MLLTLFSRNFSCASLLNSVLLYMLKLGVLLVAFYKGRLDGEDAVLCSRNISWEKPWQLFLPSPEAGPRHRFGVQCHSMYPVDTGCDVHSLGEQAKEGFPVSISWKDLVHVFPWTKEETYLIWCAPIEPLYSFEESPQYINLITTLHHSLVEMPWHIK